MGVQGGHREHQSVGAVDVNVHMGVVSDRCACTDVERARGTVPMGSQSRTPSDGHGRADVRRCSDVDFWTKPHPSPQADTEAEHALFADAGAVHDEGDLPDVARGTDHDVVCDLCVGANDRVNTDAAVLADRHRTFDGCPVVDAGALANGYVTSNVDALPDDGASPEGDGLADDGSFGDSDTVFDATVCTNADISTDSSRGRDLG